MQAVLENAQKQAKEDKSKNMQKKRCIPDGIKEEILETVAVDDCSKQNTCTEQKPLAPQNICEQSMPQQNTPTEPAVVPELKEAPPKLPELKEVPPKLPELDVTLQTSPSPSNRQKLLTPSKFRNQTCSSVAIQTEMSK